MEKQHRMRPEIEQAILTAVIIRNYETLVTGQSGMEIDFGKIEEAADAIHKKYWAYHESMVKHPPIGLKGDNRR